LFKTTGPDPRSVDDMAPTFNAIGIAVTDMAASLAFYRRLGLDFPPGSDQEPHAETQVAGGIRLMWDTHAALQSHDPSYTPGAPGGGWAFLCADPAEVDSVHADLVAAGHTSENAPWDAPWGQRYAQVQDPDGNIVDLFAWIKAND
jgi:catechol 2,3-dioxygenase-like lactoylglutathione lyase family enzyme